MSNRITRRVGGDREITKLSIARGMYENANYIEKFSLNQNIDTTFQELWTTGGFRTLFAETENSTVEVKSTSTEDAPGGTGIGAVTLVGYDENWKVQRENLVLDGTTGVLSQRTWRDINRATAKSPVGSNGSNVGTIQISRNATYGAADIMAEIIPDYGQTQMSHIIVPAVIGENDNPAIGVTDGLSLSTSKSGSEVRVHVVTRAWDEDLGLFGPKIHKRSFFLSESETFETAIRIPAKTLLYLEAARVSGGGTQEVDCQYLVYYFPDPRND